MSAHPLASLGAPRPVAVPAGPPLRILFVGPLVAGSTTLQRCQTLQREGHQLTAVNTLPAPWSRVALTLPYRALHRLGGPYDLAFANHQLLALARTPAPDVVWIEKGRTIEAATLRALRGRWPLAAIVAYSPDDMFNPRNQSRQWRACLPLYDLHVTTKRHNRSELREAGARDVLVVVGSFDSLVHRPMPVDEATRTRFGGDVGFIGWPEPERAQSMRSLAEHGVPVRIWGPWAAWHGTHPNLRIEGRPLWTDDYARAISAFRINLCFLRKVNRDRHTSRTIEIPACGGFMLAERTDEHLELFEEDREAVYFSSDEELLEKVTYYLAHEAERVRIAAAGRARCWSGGYAYEHRLRDVLRHVAARASERSDAAAGLHAGVPRKSEG